MKDYLRKVKERFIENRERRDQGKLNGLPWYLIFPRLGEVIPALPKGIQVMFTANSGIGKSHTWLGMIVYSVYKIKKIHPELDLRIRFLIVLLEDTKDMFITRLFSMILFDKYNIIADEPMLNSRGKRTLRQDIIEKLDDVENEISELLEYCEVCDSIYNPTGIYHWAKDISEKRGAHHFVDKTFSEKTVKVYSHYEPIDPEEHVIMIVDNLNNLAQETRSGSLLSQRETINAWSRDYCRLNITKHWSWTVINILQQSAESEKQQFDVHSGGTIIDKVKPSLDGLGNSKECQRDHMLILGIFAPNRYGVIQYPKPMTDEDKWYNVGILKDNFRSLIVLKSNISQCNKEIPLYFDGACSMFRELPKLDDWKKLNEVYEYVKTKNTHESLF